MFGEKSLLGSADPGVKAVALTDCIVWMVPQPQAQALALRYPVLSWGLLQTMGRAWRKSRTGWKRSHTSASRNAWRAYSWS